MKRRCVRILPDVDLAVISGNYAIDGGLKMSDALAVEERFRCSNGLSQCDRCPQGR
ncbi:MAG: hypothetical protein ACLS8R_02645 [Anaeromassilibacillus sp.]